MRFVKQYDAMDCGPSCLSMIASYYGKDYSLESLREKSFITKEGVSLLGISQAAEDLGFESIGAQLTPEQLQELDIPCILHWNANHFVVLERYERKKSLLGKHTSWHILDPGYGRMSLNDEKFLKSWNGSQSLGLALLLEPTQEFYEKEPVSKDARSFSYLFDYFKAYKKRMAIVFSLLLLGSIITFITPFLTQLLIDEGIEKKNVSYIQLILLSQILLYTGYLSIEVVRNWIMLYIGTRLGIEIVTDFLQKMFKLPMKFFETKMIGDFNQRISDNERIENFLSSQSLITFFSILTFTVFFIVLSFYNLYILSIYLTLTILSVLWSNYFMQRRKALDYYKFQQNSQNQQNIYEMLNGVSEIKLNRFEEYKTREWKNAQEKLFGINIKLLRLDQFQLSGFEFINQVKNILVTFLAAVLVVRNELTLGSLLSISYIIGMMNSPVNQLVTFFRSLQDAKLSLQRLNEVNNYNEEESAEMVDLSGIDRTKGIVFSDVSFQYEGPKSPYVLKGLNFTIPYGKVTAIVGASGSGKSTLMKLLLKFYPPSKGDIYFGDYNINSISPASLRDNTGVVMQDGFIFSDSVMRNIATSDEAIDHDKLYNAAHIANLRDFIDVASRGFNSMIGASGTGISGGQRQRILIARAVYKNPEYIFFDEATSSLDAENEKIIHDNLQDFFTGKTVVIIAHRLSTVKNADNILVLDKGMIAEEGSHSELVQQRGKYFNLIKNQLELGN